MGNIKGFKDLSEQISFLQSEDPVIPSDEEEKEFREVFDFLKNKDNWKFPTKTFTTPNLDLAGEIADALIFFTGGAEVSFIGDRVVEVSSKGYYHYIGT